MAVRMHLGIAISVGAVQLCYFSWAGSLPMLLEVNIIITAEVVSGTVVCVCVVACVIQGGNVRVCRDRRTYSMVVGNAKVCEKIWKQNPYQHLSSVGVSKKLARGKLQAVCVLA